MTKELNEKKNDLITRAEAVLNQAKAVKFGFMQMLNEGIDIDNEENGEDNPLLTMKQVGRIITEIGFDSATSKLTETVVKSTENGVKNA